MTNEPLSRGILNRSRGQNQLVQTHVKIHQSRLTHGCLAKICGADVSQCVTVNHDRFRPKALCLNNLRLASSRCPTNVEIRTSGSGGRSIGGDERGKIRHDEVLRPIHVRGRVPKPVFQRKKAGIGQIPAFSSQTSRPRINATAPLWFWRF